MNVWWFILFIFPTLRPWRIQSTTTTATNTTERRVEAAATDADNDAGADNDNDNDAAAAADADADGAATLSFPELLKVFFSGDLVTVDF